MDKIKIQNFNLYYNETQALHNINISIKETGLTAFIGPSGCGKSTLLKSINRMTDLIEGCKTTGDILINEKSIYRTDDVNILRKNVGMVFQKPTPFPMSIYDNIAYGPHTHNITNKKMLFITKKIFANQKLPNPFGIPREYIFATPFLWKNPKN